VTPGRHGWNLVTNLVLLKDSIGSANSRYDDDEVFALAMEMSLESVKNFGERLDRKEELPSVRQVMRVVPKWKTIKDIPGVLPPEDTREIFKNSPPIALVRCPCRVVYKNKPCKDTYPLETCLAAGKTGQRLIDRGAGRELSYAEFLALLDKLDEFPLVNLVPNTNRLPQFGLCHCHPDCCGTFMRSAYTEKLLGKVGYAKSRFLAEANPAECTACGICTHRCPVNAISMKYYPEFDEERSYTDPEACIGCGLCVLTCPVEARKMKLVRPPQHIPAPDRV
jgi:Na+-translocating ferredoxin:NAD+ oxidoreductase subunit B